MMFGSHTFFVLPLALAGLSSMLVPGLCAAPAPIEEDAPWPRIRSTNGHTVTLHLPQVERWTSNSFSARAAVEVKPAKAKKELLGVVWFEAHGRVDHSDRLVTLDRFEVTRARFPEALDNGSNALAIVREVIPAGARTVSLDYLITALGFVQAAARQGPAGLKHTPPRILWATNRTVLVLIDGEPVLRPIQDVSLQRVVNTPALLVRDEANAKFYLAGNGRWFVAGLFSGPWALAQNPPAAVAALAPAPASDSTARDEEPLPRIIVSTSPAELVMTGGLPDFRPIRGTALQYAADSDSQLFFHATEREAYLLLSGRWFKAKSLNGPWNHVPPRELPADFARIPPGTAQGVVLASVPNTPQAELAVLANSVPTTATVSLREATIELSYDGEPKFKPIEGTSLSYAVNASLPVIQTGDSYYALDTGVWFTSSSPTNSWQVATEVPEVIYTIPPNSPVYHATFARVYQATEDEVETGYTAGYQGTFEDDGTMVYGTGWDYETWSGDEYYGWGWTWGYSYVYVPWYQWWCWREWWNPPGGLRAALIENVYERWQGRNGVIHHDQPAQRATKTSSQERFLSGYPAVYGRFKGTSRPAPLSPPPNTLALNPYARPKAAARRGDIPRGAQLLVQTQKASGGGRNLYASPDGHVYLRKNDGWYRRQAEGNWSFFAPTHGPIERTQMASARGAPSTGDRGVYHLTPGRNSMAHQQGTRGDRVPDAGFEARAQEVAALERQYYASAFSQLRAQEWRSTYNVRRPGRGGGRRR